MYSKGEFNMQNNEEDKLLIAKIADKIEISKTKNKITNSYFLNEFQVSMLEKQLKIMKEKQYLLYVV